MKGFIEEGRLNEGVYVIKGPIADSTYIIKRNKGPKVELGQIDAYSVYFRDTEGKEVYSGSTIEDCEAYIETLHTLVNAEWTVASVEETTEEFFDNANKRAKQKGMDHDGIVIFGAQVDTD